MTLRREIRGLTEGERNLLRPLFGERFDLDRVRLCGGAGRSLVAKIAFLKGHPAIVLGQVIFVRCDRYRNEFCAGAADAAFLAHEATHVWQNQTGGINLISYVWQWLTLPGRGYDIAHLPPDARFEDLGYEQQAQVMAARARRLPQMPQRADPWRSP